MNMERKKKQKKQKQKRAAQQPREYEQSEYKRYIDNAEQMVNNPKDYWCIVFRSMFVEFSFLF